MWLFSKLVSNRFTLQCYIFHLRRGSLPDVNLHHRDLIARELPDIRKVAISPRSQQIACIVRDKDDDKNPASLYFGSVGSPNRWQLGMILDWPAADVVQLSFSTDNDLHIVFRPQFAARSRKFEIPVLYVCLQSKQLYSLIIEPQVSTCIFESTLFLYCSNCRGNRALKVAVLSAYLPRSLPLAKSLT